MTYGDHNFIEITQRTKLLVAPVALSLVVPSQSSQSSSTCRASRAVLFDKLDTAEINGLDMLNVSSHVELRHDNSGGIWALLTTPRQRI